MFQIYSYIETNTYRKKLHVARQNLYKEINKKQRLNKKKEKAKMVNHSMVKKMLPFLKKEKDKVFFIHSIISFSLFLFKPQLQQQKQEKKHSFFHSNVINKKYIEPLSI